MHFLMIFENYNRPMFQVILEKIWNNFFGANEISGIHKVSDNRI